MDFSVGQIEGFYNGAVMGRFLALGILSGFVLVLLFGCGGPPKTASNDGSVTLNVAIRGAHYRLPNGLEVFLHPDPSLRNAIVDVRYHVGGKDDPPGRSGFAHLYEHLMFLGSKHVPASGFSKALEDASVLEYNAHTTLDGTEYYEVMLPSQLPIALWLEADRMGHPIDRVDEDAFRRERDVVKNEWRQRYDNQPYGHVFSIVQSSIFPEGHPYHRSPIGNPEDLDRASLAEARAFATQYYVPINATLVVAGDFDLNVVRPIVDQLFSSIPSGRSPPPRTFPAVRLTKDRRVTVEADVEAPHVIVAWPAPPPFSHGFHELGYACRFIAGMTSHKLETEQTISRSVRGMISPGRLGSIVSINVELEPKGNVNAVIAAIETRVRWTSQVDRVRGFEWRNFSTSRTEQMTATVLSLASLGKRAERIQDYLDYLNEPDSAQTELRQIQAVKPVDMAMATEEILADAGKLVVVVVPEKGAPRAGRVVQ